MNKTAINNIQHLQTLDDVQHFFNLLVLDESLCFHPDDSFFDYVEFTTNTPAYTSEEASHRNELMDEAFEICEKTAASRYGVTVQPDDLIYMMANETIHELVELPNRFG